MVSARNNLGCIRSAGIEDFAAYKVWKRLLVIGQGSIVLKGSSICPKGLSTSVELFNCKAKRLSKFFADFVLYLDLGGLLIHLS